jgi:hypothetical protein
MSGSPFVTSRTRLWSTLSLYGHVITTDIPTYSDSDAFVQGTSDTRARRFSESATVTFVLAVENASVVVVKMAISIAKAYLGAQRGYW